MAQYIMDLRKIVGHRPLMQCGASVILEDKDGRILLQKRADTHEWGYHGGSVELGEIVEEAAARELEEETGLTADELILFGVFSGPEMHNVYPNGDEVYNIDTVFLCTKWHGTLRCQEGEVEALEFFAPDDLPDDIFPPNRPAIGRWREIRKKEDRIR